MKLLLLPLLLFLLSFSACASDIHRPTGISQNAGYVDAAVNLIQAVKDGNETSSLQQLLQEADQDKLAAELTTDALRRGFWINIYNAYVIILLKESPELYDDRGAFFSDKRFVIAGEQLSFDDVEHGILRRSTNKYSLGYLGKIRISQFERKFRVDSVDGRIHFALNCGAKSCPPVRVYHPTMIDQEMDESTHSYLQDVTLVEGNQVSTTVLFNWFRNDFGDRGGVTEYLKRFEIVAPDMDPDISYLEYDWTLDIDNFSE